MKNKPEKKRKMESQAMEAKVVLLGSQGVGKTSLVLRFVQQTYKHETRPTIGASFLTKRVLAFLHNFLYNFVYNFH